MVRIPVTMMVLLITTVAAAQTSDTRRKATKPPAYSEQFDFKGIRLGMTLSEFKVAPVPEDGDKSRDYEPPSAWCGNNLFLTTSVMDKADNAGVVYCMWVQRKPARTDEYKIQWPEERRSVPVRIAGRRMEMYSFEFIAKPDDAEPRLFRMNFYDKDSLNAIAQKYDIFGAALAERFGKPTAVEVRPVQNAFGAVFEQEIRVWENKHGKIALMRFEPSLEYTTLRYFIPEYVDYHSARLGEEQRRNGPKL